MSHARIAAPALAIAFALLASACSGTADSSAPCLTGDPSCTPLQQVHDSGATAHDGGTTYTWDAGTTPMPDSGQAPQEDASSGEPDAGEDAAAPPPDAGHGSDGGGTSNKQPLGGTCAQDSDCESNMCRGFRQQSVHLCTQACTQNTAATDCPVPPTAGQCTPNLYCKFN